MAKTKKDNPWWGNADTLWGGETFAIQQSNRTLGVKKGDLFRIERRGRAINLIPHPKNDGLWKNAHSKKNPIKLNSVGPRRNRRAFSMLVKFVPSAPPRQLFLVERRNRTIAIKDSLKDPGSDGGLASVRR